MIKHSFVLLLLLSLCFSCEPTYHSPRTTFIDSDWSFKSLADNTWREASVPGDVYSDLFSHNLIANPYVAENELNVQWVAENDWEYKTNFRVDDSTFTKKNIHLNFEGLDTFASVFLNDSLILQTNNAFRSYDIDVKPFIKKENKLHIVFNSTHYFEEEGKNKLNYKLPEGERIFIRKPQFQYGWDWAPKLKTSGIWKPISLTSWNDLKINDVFLVQNSIEESLAKLTAQVEFTTSLNEELTFEIVVNDDVVAKSKVQVDSSTTKYEVPFEIEDPQLWWPHNIGEPYLYDVGVRIKKGWSILDYKGLSKGLRTIELVTEKDSVGESFYFKVNDVPVYVKGSNYVPQNSLQNKVADTDYEKLLNDVVDANMNMIRVWGGGIYEEDTFYDLCDQNGILVWQDFMFACAMYPGDKEFMDNVTQEAIEQVTRLRNHTSIALWCGNNENSEGWENWHWKDGLSKAQQAEVWNNYIKLFNNILPNTVRDLTDNTSYWETSPKFGRGNPNYNTEGDTHDWFVWHDAYPFEHFEEKVPRFMSEFGFQSFPTYETIKYISQNDSVKMDSLRFSLHQKHTRGAELINEYMKRDFPVPSNFEDYVYMSQVLQAYGITKGAEAHRRAKPYNMGSMYWQLNDCWPSVSWSSIDFLGNWKALHYQAKKAYKNVITSSIIQNDTLKTYIINDEMKEQRGSLSLRIIDFKGNELWSVCDTTNVQPLSSELKYALDIKSLKLKKNEVVFEASFNNSVSYFYFSRPKDLMLHTSEIEQTITKTETGFIIELQSETLQKDVFLYTDTKGHFSDNYFDLMPNERKVIEFQTRNWEWNDLNIKTLNQFVKAKKEITKPSEAIQ
ncbi:glycoside hydrolase family 2 protein [Subsaxibacter sp. CAU 1640]|uniref:beta-mannosidase n=1 Tax=Subsaxibacter sp. CAU 1640 TaxID=2933271 RepID=UPI0020055051|nr:glycoside hydrolase family 2 protein [Subsaxibacter sp. CAU 1640]MCK7590848.1 glycoside hydrolase family 2 protein [Subsaxibacter sp. CAU 1640]